MAGAIATMIALVAGLLAGGGLAGRAEAASLSSVSTSRTGSSLDLAVAPAVDRIGGADRFEVAAGISRLVSGSITNTVFIVSGEKFADALSAGPIASSLSAPLLLTRQAELPAATRTELLRLAPRLTQVIVVGGPASISAGVLAELRGLLPSAALRRVDGADRFAVSRALLTGDLAPTSPKTLYIASGLNFPDALSSTAAAAHFDTRVLLVNGGADALSDEEMHVINTTVGSGQVVRIAGGPASVSLAIEAQIATIATVRRLGGADRYEASNAIALDAFRGWTPSHRVFLASGSVFADALAGGAVAGQFDAPLLLARTDCVPPAALDIARGEGIEFVTVLGGPTTLSPQVERLEPCV